MARPLVVLALLIPPAIEGCAASTAGPPGGPPSADGALERDAGSAPNQRDPRDVAGDATPASPDRPPAREVAARDDTARASGQDASPGDLSGDVAAPPGLPAGYALQIDEPFANPS